MADRRIDELNQASVLSGTDILMLEQDPSGAKVPRKASLTTLANYFTPNNPGLYDITKYGAVATIDGSFNCSPALAAADAAATAGGGVVTVPFVLPGMKWGISSQTVFTSDLVGSGPQNSVFFCKTAGAGISLGSQTVASTTGMSGYFRVDGNNIATRPLTFGYRTSSTFDSIQSWYGDTNAANDGVMALIAGTQNCQFNACWFNHGNVLLRFDGGAANNQFNKGELSDAFLRHLEFRGTFAVPGQGPFPFYNTLTDTIMELTEPSTANMVWSAAGLYNRLVNCPMYINGHFDNHPDYLPTAMSAAILLNTADYVSSSLRIDYMDAVGYAVPTYIIDCSSSSRCDINGGLFQVFNTAFKGPITVLGQPQLPASVTTLFDATGYPFGAPVHRDQFLTIHDCRTSADFVSGTYVSTSDTTFRMFEDAKGTRFYGSGVAAADVSLGRVSAGLLQITGGLYTTAQLRTTTGLGVGNTVAKTTLATPGTVVKMMEVFSDAGVSLGAIPIYPKANFT